MVPLDNDEGDSCYVHSQLGPPTLRRFLVQEEVFGDFTTRDLWCYGKQGSGALLF